MGSYGTSPLLPSGVGALGAPDAIVFVSVRLDNLRDRGPPEPPDFGDTDYRLQRNLEQVAANEAIRRKAPCKYLGLLSEGRFYPDPAKWTDHQYPPREEESCTCAF